MDVHTRTHTLSLSHTLTQICYAAPEDAILVSGSYDRMVKVWDCRSKSIDPIQSMQAAGDSITTVVVNERYDDGGGGGGGVVYTISGNYYTVVVVDIVVVIVAVVIMVDNR